MRIELDPIAPRNDRVAARGPRGSIRKSAVCPRGGRAPVAHPSAPASAAKPPAAKPAGPPPIDSPPADGPPASGKWPAAWGRPTPPTRFVCKRSLTVSYCLRMTVSNGFLPPLFFPLFFPQALSFSSALLPCSPPTGSIDLAFHTLAPQGGAGHMP